MITLIVFFPGFTLLNTSIQQVLGKSRVSLGLWLCIVFADVNGAPVCDSTVGMNSATENHLANIGTQINPTMPCFERGHQFSPAENNAHQVEVGFTPPGSRTCAKPSCAEKGTNTQTLLFYFKSSLLFFIFPRLFPMSQKSERVSPLE